MTKKKLRLKVLLFVIACTPTLLCYGANSTLVIEMTNGKTAKYALQEEPMLTMNSSRLEIKTSDIETSYERANVLKLYFIDTTDSKVENLTKEQITFRQTTEYTFLVSGLTAKQPLTVSDMAGRQFSQTINREESKAVINLRDCPEGIYILSVGKEQTIKIVKK